MARGVLPIAFTGENEGVPEAGTLSSCQNRYPNQCTVLSNKLCLFSLHTCDILTEQLVGFQIRDFEQVF